MDYQMECDQQLIQRNNFKQVNEGERTGGFIKRTTSLPIVSGTIFYATLTYNTVKGKNALVGSFMAGIENIVRKGASVTIDATQKVVSFNYLDNLACKGLDKIEYNIPLIRKPWDKIVKDSREYILNKISGESNTPKTPTTVIEAFGKRKRSLELLLSEALWNNKASTTVILVFNKVLDKAESIVDFIFPNQDNENCPKEGDSLWPRISCLASNTKKSLISLARELKKEETNDDKVTVKDVALVTNHWLSQYHKSLQENPEREGMVLKALRLSALSTVWTILTFNGVVAATLPRAENYVSSVMYFIKRASTRVLTPIKSSVDKVVGPLKTAFTMSLEIVRDTYEEILANLNKIFQNFPDTIRKMISSGLKLPNESFAPKNESIVPQVSSYLDSRESRPSHSDPKADVSKEISSSNSLYTNKSFQDCPVTESSTPDFLSLLDSQEEKEKCEETLKENNVELLEESEEGFFGDVNETIFLASGKEPIYGSVDTTPSYAPSNFKVKKIFKWPKF